MNQPVFRRTEGPTRGRQHGVASPGDVEDQQRLRAVHDGPIHGGHAAAAWVQEALHLVLVRMRVIRRQDGLRRERPVVTVRAVSSVCRVTGLYTTISTGALLPHKCIRSRIHR